MYYMTRLQALSSQIVELQTENKRFELIDERLRKEGGSENAQIADAHAIIMQENEELLKWLHDEFFDARESYMTEAQELAQVGVDVGMNAVKEMEERLEEEEQADSEGEDSP